MKQLPKYAFLTHPSEFESVKVIMLEHPFIVANILEVSQSNTERVERLMEDLVQERYPLAKTKGFSVFLRVDTSLVPCGNPEFQQSILNEMAEFVLTERILRKIGQFRNCDETERSAKYCEKVKRERIRLRERKRRMNETND